MLQTFEATLNNGHIIWNDPVHLPQNAKVLVTILQADIEMPKTEKPSINFRGALQHLSKVQKEQNNIEIQKLRGEWEREI